MSRPSPRGPRLRELGLRIGRFEAGPANAITDVAGVTVGHVTVWRDEPEPPDGRGVARTGVTAVLPGPVETLHAAPVPGGDGRPERRGRADGLAADRRLGLHRDARLPHVHARGRTRLRRRGRGRGRRRARVGTEDFVIPVVGECDDSWLSEGRVVQVEAADVGRAVAAAAGGAVAEGAVGARYRDDDEGLQGGHRHGESDRAVDRRRRRRPRPLELLPAARPRHGRRARRRAPRRASRDDAARRREAASRVVAVDAPLSPHQLERVARRVGLGLARCGSVAHHGSGEIFVAFAPPGRRPRGEAPVAGRPRRRR